MLGKNHIISNTCTLLLMASGVMVGRQLDATTILNQWIVTVTTGIYNFIVEPQYLPALVVIPLSIIFFYFGTLLPDIDSETSILGRYIHVPIEHRTWTHTLWIVIIFVFIGLTFRPILWLAVGYLLHLFWDNLSVGGVCFLYPMVGYRTYGRGAKIKKGHILKVYRVGSASEYVVITVLIMTTLFTLYHTVTFLYFT